LDERTRRAVAESSDHAQASKRAINGVWDEQNLSCIEPILKEVRMESTISTEDLKGKLDRKESIKVIETLAPERYREAHLPGALNIPPEQIKELAPQLLPNKDAEIVTYCTNTH
jgi:3-mercaptopyruvate sulfurtransferase SseA